MAGDTWVEELEDGQVVDATFAVQRKTRRRTRAGAPFLSVELADRTGRVPAVVWNDVNVIDGRFTEGDTVRVLGRVGTYDGRLQIELRDLEKLAPGGGRGRVAPAATRGVRPAPRRDAETLDGMVEFLAGEIHHPGLAALVGRFLG